MLDILFRDVLAVTVDGENWIVPHAFVGVKDGKLAYISAEPPAEEAKETVDGRDKVLMPGLINAHTHLPMTVLRGWADDMALQPWLYDNIFPREAKLDDRCVLTGAVLGIAESLSFGTTAFCEMYGHTDMVLQAARSAGIKMNACNGCLSFDDEFGFETCPDTVYMREMHEKWHGFDKGRLRFDASIHAQYTSDWRLWEAVAEYAINNGLRMQIHLSETKKEHEDCKEKYGLTPAALMDCHNVWLSGGVAAHGVWLEKEDMALLARRGISVAHNPISNQKLGSGCANVAEMLRSGINVALGTDGAASNNNLDMFEEMKAAALLAKNRDGDPEALSAREALYMATAGGAAALGRGDECGRLKVGMDADMILLDFDRPHLTPVHNVISNLVYSAKGSDVIMTMVRGRVLYQNGEFKTLDWKRARAELQDYVIPRVFGE